MCVCFFFFFGGGEVAAWGFRFRRFLASCGSMVWGSGVSASFGIKVCDAGFGLGFRVQGYLGFRVL